MKNKRLILSAIFLLGIALTSVQLQAQTDMKTGTAREIQQAVIAGDLNKVQALIDADLTLLESKDNSGNTLLIIACQTRQVSVANYLIDKGANVNAKTNIGGTPLFYLGRDMDKYLDLVQHLIDKGAEVNVKLLLNRNWTLFFQTVKQGNLKAAKLLIDHGADINVKDTEGTPLQMVIYNLDPNCRNIEMAKLLIESGAKLQEFSYGNTELHMVAMKGCTDLVPLLVKHGANVNAVNIYGHTPLYYATIHGHRKAADALIAEGANESTILEINYGKAQQLSEKLGDGEAYLWYLSGPASGYAVKTKEHLLIFNPLDIDESPEAGLANGYLNPHELTGQKITVLITHWAGQNVSKLAEIMPGADFVLSFKPGSNIQPSGGLKIGTDTTGNSKIPPYRLANANESFSIGGIQVHTTTAIPNQMLGNSLGYLVEADGVKIFYAGLHASDNDSLQVIKYRKDIDLLKPFGPIDIVILPIKGNHIYLTYEPYLYLLDQLSPKVVYLMGDNLATEEHTKCIEVLQTCNIPVEYPEGGIAIGERFHYLRDVTKK